jgi:hypothetical protein
VRKERRETVLGHRPGSRSFPFCRSPPAPLELYSSVARRRSESPTGRPRDDKLPRARLLARSVSLCHARSFLDMLCDVISCASSLHPASTFLPA